MTENTKMDPTHSTGVRALVVGRFQPFHKGHVGLIKRAIEDCVRVAVGIGSATAKTSLRNPFTFEERKLMIAAAFPRESASGALEVFALPDIHDPPRWADHTVSITGPVGKVYGNDDENLGLFEDAGMTVVRTGLVEREKYGARTIRMQIAEGDPSWRKAVPPAVADLLDKFDAAKRLRALEAYA